MTTIEQLKPQLEALREDILNAIALSKTRPVLYDVKVKYFGKSGPLTALMKETGKLSSDLKPLWGQLVNSLMQEVQNNYAQKEEQIKQIEIEELMSAQELDVTLSGVKPPMGTYHPLTIVTQQIVAILSRLGYSLRLGPIIESDFYNFEALNIAENHPAREMQDTFFVGPKHVLRTHTSPIQIHSLEKESLPLKVMGTGGVFRCDSDISHLPHFHQIEGLYVAEQVSMADLKGTIRFFVKEFFAKDLKIRFRPSYFPFTEPSAEVDCQCPICQGKGCSLCKQTGWIEIGGCGLVNPKVLESVHVDSKRWQGFAFGFGIERMAMIKYHIGDIRLLPENDLRFLKQFS